MGLIAKIRELNYKRNINRLRELIIGINNLIPMEMATELLSPVKFYNKFSKSETMALHITRGDNIAKMKANTLRVNLLEAATVNCLHIAIVIIETDDEYLHDVRLSVLEH